VAPAPVAWNPRERFSQLFFEQASLPGEKTQECRERGLRGGGLLSGAWRRGVSDEVWLIGADNAVDRIVDSGVKRPPLTDDEPCRAAS
jgi:hypothetical protein